MILYLRDKNNNDFAEIELYEKSDGFVECTSHLYSENIFNILLTDKYNLEFKKEFAQDMIYLEKTRMWHFEVYNQSNNKPFDEVLEAMRKRIRSIANKYNMDVVED